ncbi:MAG: hypothetical protein DRP02_02280 [Candidatus Gerdarchaeota archaeon]|nr:MAG: hypothetical protein DRP02_02280 [Candidatus Gerdarchaeota archaeon]
MSQERIIPKIVALAKNGVGGEKTAAILKLKQLCEKHDLDFDEVMSETEGKIEKFFIKYKNKQEWRIGVQVICRYAHQSMNQNIWGSKSEKELYFETTKQKFVDTLVAMETLKKAFKEEQKLFLDAFIKKHNLYYQKTEEEWDKFKEQQADKEESPEDFRRNLRVSGMASHMESVELQKRLQ